MSESLPLHWSNTTIGEICERVSQRGPSADCDTFQYIDLSAIDNSAKAIVSPKTVPVDDAPSRAKQNVRSGDVLFSTVRVYLENIAQVTAALDGAVASTAFCVLRPGERVEARYLYHFATSRRFVVAVNEAQRGNSPPSVQDADVRNQPFPLPRNEQKRIASRIDELFSRITEGERALNRVESLVKSYRQSVLKAAVTGELTRDWRERGAGKSESGEALLERILIARREAWEASELARMKAAGIKPANDKWKAKYSEPTRPDPSERHDLPFGWVWASLDQLSTKVTSGSRDWKDFYGRGTSVFVMAQNIRPRLLEFKDIQYVDPPQGDRDAERSRVARDDLLITIVGANTGDTCRVREALVDHFVCQSVALIRPVLPVLSPYLEAFIAADEGGQAQFARSIYGAGRPHLSFDQLKSLAVPLPPLPEQASALDAIALAESRLETSLAAVTSARGSALSVKQAILAAAFQGRLG